ncbi:MULTISPECIES: AAA family ATPase [unclassified Agrococcus]|uniref:AAA family ATPase n=1 Tax=unclassified Agrococcus TaxID=2615065 RepID=UPI0036206E9B
MRRENDDVGGSGEPSASAETPFWTTEVERDGAATGDGPAVTDADAPATAPQHAERERGGHELVGASAPAPERAPSAPAAPDAQQVAPEPARHDDASAPRRRDWQSWRLEVERLGGRSPLASFVDTTATRIELSTTHPGGLAQFITGRPTALSSLIRDDLALRAARNAAAAIASKGIDLAASRSIDAVHLGIGIVRFPHEHGELHGPVLLRPLVVRRRGRDFELQLQGRPYLNPRLAHVLRTVHGVELDERALVSLADHEGTFTPNPVLDRIRLAAAHVPGFQVLPRLVVSTFAEVGPAMAADLRPAAHTVLDAVTGDEAARWRLREGRSAVAQLPLDERSPQADRLVLDADAEQDAVVGEIVAGNSLVVEALPGTGVTQTVVNAIAALVDDDRRVLVVSPRRATTQGIVDRLAATGLPGLAVRPQTLRRDLIAAITRSEQAQRPDTGEIDDALERLRKVLLDYRGALRRVDDELQVSVLDCLRALSRLAMLPTPPQTQARLAPDTVRRLAQDRPRTAATMVQAAELGQFRFGPEDTPWYGANFTTDGDAATAREDARSLAHGGLAELVDEGRRVLGATKLRPFDSVAELGAQLRLLADIRETLDRFVPSVFDRPLGELITATGPRREANAALGGLQRRRLKRLALEYVRPGAVVGDLHEALVGVQRQRKLWTRWAPDGAVPSVPTGLGGLEAKHRAALAALDGIDAALVGTDSPVLVDLPLDALQQRLDELAAPSEALDSIQERATLMSTLAELELEPLVADLATRHVEHDEVAHELDLAWWQSALEQLLQRERALLRGNTTVLERLESDFALVDEAHVDAASGRLAWQLAQSWRLAIADHADEAEALRALLRGGGLDPAQLQGRAPHVSRAIAPVWVASPYDVHRVARTIPFDVVIVLDAGAVTLAEAVGAITRAPQVVAIGDPATQIPSPFDVGISALGVRPSYELGSPDELHGESALARLAEVLPVHRLARTYRTGGADLIDAVSRRFYDGAIETLPWAGTYLGHASLTVSTVQDAWGLPDQQSSLVESPDAEVERVIALVTHHARTRPHESLMVVTGNERHEVRVQQAVVQALGQPGAFADFVVADSDEPFVVADVAHANALSRDRVIFSVGYARTRYGRAIELGRLADPGGDRMLAVAMTRARKAMTLVAAFQAADLDGSRLEHGAAVLRDVLLEAERPHLARSTRGGDPLLTDLARRLEARGLRTTVDYAGLPLVVANGGVCAAIETDHEDDDRPLRETLRVRPEHLRRLGWHTMRVHAFELFTDPDAVAARIATLVGADASE